MLQNIFIIFSVIFAFSYILFILIFILTTIFIEKIAYNEKIYNLYFIITKPLLIILFISCIVARVIVYFL